MTSKQLNIASVKLVNGGLKGIEVKYQQTEIKNNREFFNEYISKRKSPIHSELENTFAWLKNHLLDICCYPSDEQTRQILTSNLEMVSVNYNDKGFILSGKLTVLGDKTLSLTTPLIESQDDYAKFNVVTAIL